MNERLLEAIKNDKVVFFVGSGFSKCFDFPDWNQLLVDVLEQISVEDDKFKNLIPVLQTGIMSPIQVLNIIKNYKTEVYEYIKRKFIIESSDDRRLVNHKKLWNISKKIITTNYDAALELANPKAEKIIYSYDYEVTRLNQSKEYLFKLHGSIENISNCILFEDDYKKLYDRSDKKCAVFQLEKIITENIIVFLGFSMKDPYVCDIFESMSKTFNNFMNKHFIFSTEDEDFSKYSTNIIKLSNWNEIGKYLDDFINYKEQFRNESAMQNLVPIASIQESKLKQDINKTRVALLVSDPIDKVLGYNMQEVASCFNNLNINLDCYYMSIDRIRELDEYDYLIIFTKATKDKIYIEDEFLKCTSITLKDFEDNLCINNLRGIYVFVDDFAKVKYNEMNTPIIMCKTDTKLKDLVFKLFRRADRKYIDSCCRISNIDLDEVPVFEKGEAKISYFKANSLGFIDTKNIQGFIGRNTDLETIIPKILKAKFNGRILNIKGAGGIGKTTIVKKTVYELAKRGYFKDGIYFIDCEHLDNYSLLEHRISQCFELDNTIDFVNYLAENNLDKNLLIILDNFETLQYVEDSTKIKELVKLVSDYSTIIITSREVIYSDINTEDIHELRNFTTDEAVKLFINNYPSIKENEIKKLRTDILEDLLNNNPLAISIVSKNLPRGKDINYLKKELETDFFNTINRNIVDIYDSQPDFNIERSKSLFQSINYSYRRLTEREKLAFKLLSLFPDGIDIENFKEFFKYSLKKRKANPITDTDLKMLENKSLVEINHKMVKLQSIIRRFAKFQFDSISEDDRKAFYKQAYHYNVFMVSIADKIFEKKVSYACSFFDSFSSNILESMNYLDKVDDIDEDKVGYLNNVSDYFTYVARGKDFIEKLDELETHLCKTEKLKLLFNIIKLHSSFIDGDFKNSYKILREYIKLSDLNQFNTNDQIDRLILTRAMNIYFYEGHALECLEFFSQNESDTISDLNAAYFELGRYSKLLDIDREKHFFSYQMDYALGKLNLQALTKYISGIYKKDYIELVQTTFLKSRITYVNDDEINKLVVTNPYTKGLKKLMLASNEKNEEKSFKLYIDAISNLEHIKYYYVLAIYYFAKHLRENQNDSYNTWFKLGYEQAVKYKFNYLIYQFNCLELGISEDYDEGKFVDLLKDNYDDNLDGVAITS